MATWLHEIDLSGVWKQYVKDDDFEAARDAISAVFELDPWASRHEFDWLIADAVNPSEFEAAMNRVYDQADYDRVWINTF